jgi:hypothetical protein
MNDELAKSLTLLSTKLGTSIEHLWEVLRFQAKVTAIQHITIFTILIVALTIGVKKVWPLFKDDTDTDTDGFFTRSEEFDKKVIKVLIIAICVIFGTMAFDGIFDSIVYIINPDYYALEQLIKIAK